MYNIYAFHIATDSDSLNSAQEISFSVALNSSQVITPGAGETIKYATVLTNDGNGFDVKTGVAGTYMFVVDAFSTPGIGLHVKINKKQLVVFTCLLRTKKKHLSK